MFSVLALPFGFRSAAWLRPALALGFLVFAVSGVLWSVVPLSRVLALLTVTSGVTVLCFVTFVSGRGFLHRFWTSMHVRRIKPFIVTDPANCILSNRNEEVVFLNACAKARFGDGTNQNLATLLQDVFANPELTFVHLHARVLKDGNVVRELVTRGGHVRITAQAMRAGMVLWRIEEIGLGPAKARAGGNLPMLTIGRGNAVYFMNAAAKTFVGDQVRNLETVFPNLPLKSGGFNLGLSSHGPRNCIVHIVKNGQDRQEVYFIPLGSDEQHAMSSDAWENLPVALLRLNVDGTIVQSNQVARGLLAIDLGRPLKLNRVLHGPGRPLGDWIGEMDRSDVGTQTEILPLLDAAEGRFVQISLTRVEGAAGRSLVAVLSDATELKSLEAQFVQSQKMQAIGELAGGIAHDFNNLLTAISGYCDLLLLRRDSSDADFADLVQINQNANRAAALVGQLLAFSRKQTLRPEITDVREALAGLAHLLNRLVGEKIALKMQHDPSPWHIRVDKRQLEQVIMNLVVNARDAMPEGGSIHVQSRNEVLSADEHRDQAHVPAGEYPVLEVRDEGCGIPPERINKIFEPFFTTKRVGEGTGLGLSTVFGIVKQSGGFVFVKSDVGIGTRFSIMFPRTEQDPIPAEETDAIQAMPVSNKPGGVILLVEDEAPVRAFASRALQYQGFHVIEASCAEEALALLEDPTLEVDVFVTDVVMPGLDGPSWVREARRQRPDTRVVFVSGYAEEVFAKSEEDLPNSEFLPKPFSLSDLCLTVQNCIQRGQKTRE